MRQKATHDKSLTEDTISKLFCNIEELLRIHQELVNDLEKSLSPSPTYEAQISQCYLRHVSNSW